MAVKKTKVVDKWKLKKWYTVIAPSMFEHQELGEVAAAEDRLLMNRILRIGLHELMGSASQNTMFTTLQFRISEINGGKAATTLIGHEVSPSYIKTFARRGKTLLHMTVDGKTKDDVGIRVKAIAVTAGKISSTTIGNLRKTMAGILPREVGSHTYDELMQEIIYGRLVSRLFNELKKITAMRRVEIRKSEKKEVFA